MSFKPFTTPPKTYLITHLTREFGVTSRALRHYEDLGLLHPVRRDGARIYSRKDRARLVLILHGRSVGLSLEKIGELLDLYESEGKPAQTASLVSTYTQQIRVLETRREEAERGIAALQLAIDQLSAVDPVQSPRGDDCRRATVHAHGTPLF